MEYRVHRYKTGDVTLVVSKPGHFLPADCTRCHSVKDKRALERIAAEQVLFGKRATWSGCAYEMCSMCAKEELGSLWRTTNEPPTPLEELFDIIQASG